jgi:hypothetical protein
MPELKAPRGVDDLLPADQPYWRWLRETATRVAESYGYGEIQTPVFEHAGVWLRPGAEGTDVVDKESSKDLINSLKLLRPRHLPLVATIGDRDLNLAVSTKPENIKDVFTQSAAEEIIHQRESALRLVESIGGLALDVTTQTLGPRLLETYLRVKERGML